MRRLLVLLMALVLGGCSYQQPGDPVGSDQPAAYAVRFFHDDAHHVSCWLYGGGTGSYTAAISCIPDSQL